MGRRKKRELNLNITPAEISEFIESVLPTLDTPEEMLGDEIGGPPRLENPDLKVAIVLPIEYDSAIINLGTLILMEVLSDMNVQCYRFYMPHPKIVRKMLREGIPAYTWETREPLAKMDIIGFSVFYPLHWLNVVKSMQLIGIPIREKDRTNDRNKYPFVIVGGPTTTNPEPLWGVPDAYFIGEAEDQIQDIAKLFKEHQSTFYGTGRYDLFKKMAKIKGVYIPSAYTVKYKKDSPVVESVTPDPGFPKVVEKTVTDLSKYPPLHCPLLPTVIGRYTAFGSVEVSRGCSHSCRFCSAGYQNRPYRERELQPCLEAWDHNIKLTGAVDLTPYAYNITDYYAQNKLYSELAVRGNLSASSQRIDKYHGTTAAIARTISPKSITLALEHSSLTMRKRFNKHYTEEEVWRALKTAMDNNVGRVKIYCISKAPLETEEDMMSIVPLMQKVIAYKREIGAQTLFRLSMTPIELKPSTAMQWFGVDEEQLMSKTLLPVTIQLRPLKVGFRVSVNFRASWLVAIFTRGDRRLMEPIIEAVLSKDLWQKEGIQFKPDATEVFESLLEAHGVSKHDYFRERDVKEVLPWDHISIGIKKSWFLREYERYKKAEFTPSCDEKCTSCGVCAGDVKVVKIIDEDVSEEFVLASLVDRTGGIMQRLRARLNIPESWRYCPSDKIKTEFRMACFRNGIDAKDRAFTLGQISQYHAWCYGVDYIDIPLGLSYKYSGDGLVDGLNAHLKHFKVIDYQLHSMKMRSLNALCWAVWYRFVINMDYNDVIRCIEEYTNRESDVLRIRWTRGLFGEIIYKEIDSISNMNGVWARRKGGSTLVTMLLNPLLIPQDVIPSMFGFSLDKTMRMLVVRREGITFDNPIQDSFLIPTCDVCGEKIEQNLFGDVVHPNRCIFHLETGDDESVERFVGRYIQTDIKKTL